jgi:guanylate kinase
MARIISISGASASGKTSVAREVLSFLPESKMLLSLTTRPSRPSDVPGEYRYVSSETFEDLKKSGSFLWSVGVHGNRYGTLRESVETASTHGTSIAILTIPAAEKLARFLRESSPETIFVPIYLSTKDEKILETRLRGRGDSEDDVRIRVEECRTWNEMAAHSDVPFHTIDAGTGLREMIRAAKEHISQALG